MQLPPDIDLMGHQHSDPASRQLYFTPCNSFSHTTAGEQMIEFVLRSGRLSSLVATPRFDSLRASISRVSNGFDLHEFNRNDWQIIAIAGGTGISPFLALSSIPVSGVPNSSRALFWSIHVRDFGLVVYVLQNSYLLVDEWKKVTIFVTTGTDTVTISSVEAKCGELRSRLPPGFQDRIEFCCRRMTEQDIRGTQNAEETVGINQTNIYFCGSKSLQWQAKRWGIATSAKVLTVSIPEIAILK